MNIKYDKVLGDLREDDVKPINVTYDELVAKIGAEELVCGSYYNITDFATVHWMADSEGEYILDGESKIVHTGENEPLVVFATSANTLAEEAYSPAHPEDVIRYDWDSDRWQSIPAFYDGNTSEVVDGWKGIIYRREDNITGNRCNFDFREITYRVWNIEQEAWDELTEYTAGDFVQVGTIIYWALDTSTVIEPGVDEGWEDYWKVVIDLSDGDGGTHSYFVLSQTGWYSAIIDDNVPIVDTEDYINRTMFIDESGYNVFEEFYTDLPYTIFGESCYLNTFGTECEENTFGAYCYNNTFGESCYLNTFGTSCYLNTFGTSCYNNTFGSDCYLNTFGTSCYLNTFGTSCYNNTFGSDCYLNTFPELAGFNEFKNYVSSLDCSTFTAVYDTNITHQIGTSGTIYQTYIDESGTPAMVISTEKIGISD